MLTAVRQGVRHLRAARSLVLLVWLAGLVVALPAAVIVQEAIHESVADRLMRDRLLRGFDTGWHGEFKANASGLEATLAPSQIGVGATLDALEAWWSGALFSLSPALIAFGLAFALVWLLLLGGILGRLRRPWNRWRLSEVLATGGHYFSRFLQLTLLAAPAYYGVYRLAKWLFPRIEHWTRDVTSETTVLAANLAAAALILLLLALIKMTVDYARIAMVVEGQRRALRALVRGASVVVRHPLATLGLVAVFAGASMAVIGLYSLVAPGADQSSGLTIVLAIVGSQIYLMVRVAIRLGLMSSELALFEAIQSRFPGT